MRNICVVIVFTLSFAMGQVDHVIFTEVVLTPSDGEYVEISNPTESAVDLTNYYLTDGTDGTLLRYYYKLASEGNFYWSEASTDFICRFPSGYTLAPGAAIKISLRDNSAYESVYGQTPDISLDDDMLSVSEESDTKGNPGSPKLHNSSETLILFYWDGSSELVKDVDYLIWGSNYFAINKTNVLEYLPDTFGPNQSLMPVHGENEKLVRLDKSSEGGETQANSNGITGHDETSEPLADTWTTASLTSAGVDEDDIVLNEFSLLPAYPNPFNPVTNISFVVHKPSEISLKIFDVNGKLVQVVNPEMYQSGVHNIQWNASSLSSGIYFIHMLNGADRHTQKVMLLK